MKISNLTLYLICIIISIVIIGFFNYIELSFSNIVTNISCSILAASLLAAVIEKMNIRRETIEKDDFKEIYFKDINNLFSIIIGHLLWFEEHKDDDFIDWSMDINYFLNIGFYLTANQFTKPYSVPFEEAIEMLNNMSEKYHLDKIHSMQDDEKFKVVKMFNIISYDCFTIMNELNKLNEDKIYLNVKNYMKLEDWDALMFNMDNCYFIISKPGANYGGAINLLTSSAQKMREISNYNDNIKIGMNEGYFNIVKFLYSQQ